MRRSAAIEWLRYGTITGLVFAAGAGVSAVHFGAPSPQVGLVAASGFAFGATIEWISLKFRTPAMAFAVILMIAFVGTLQPYTPASEEVGITQDFRALNAALKDPGTAGEGVLSGTSVNRNVESAAANAARRAGHREHQEAERAPAPVGSYARKGVRRTGGAGSP
ncbi:MAG TPA: hypothetical protein VK837_07450 [Longimicrobiales bacterium]|nr:hypothetical protein [Longimicrobiales bacterium]